MQVLFLDGRTLVLPQQSTEVMHLGQRKWHLLEDMAQKFTHTPAFTHSILGKNCCTLRADSKERGITGGSVCEVASLKSMLKGKVLWVH